MPLVETTLQPRSPKPTYSVRDVPWQLWVVIVLLAVEGIGNLLLISTAPFAAVWLGAKILFVWGFIRRWWIVYVWFCIEAALHTLAFSTLAPFVAFINLATLVLAVSQHRLFFPTNSVQRVANPQA